MDSEPPEPDGEPATFQTVPFSAPNSPVSVDGKKMFSSKSGEGERVEAPGRD